MIKVNHRGTFKKTTKYLNRIDRGFTISNIERFGMEGVAALSAATPTESGLTANSWYYTIEQKRNHISIRFNNSNIQNGVPIAIILQYGHATRNGGWVEGRDYINPAIQPVFDRLAESAWKEVTR